MALKYVGKDPNTEWLAGVPARDLTDAEVKEYPEASASPLYVAATAPKSKE